MTEDATPVSRLAITPAETPLPATPGFGINRIASPELDMNLGRQVRIGTVSGNRHSAIVLDATADAVELKICSYGGGARLPIARDQISEIELVTSDDHGMD